MRGLRRPVSARAARACAVALTLAALSAAPPAAATHWTGSGTLSPLRAFSGERVTFDFVLNNAAAERLEVFSVKMIACWHGAGGGSYIKPDDGTSVNISASASMDFVGPIDVPPLAPGLCHTTILVRGQAVSDSTAGYGDYHFDVNYSTRPPLEVNLSGGPADGPPPFNASFNASVAGGAPPYSFAWDFGDGTNASGPAASHTFALVGRYNVSVAVTDALGQARVAATDVWVHSGLAVVVRETLASGSWANVSFEASTVGAFGAVRYNWTFGDGTTGTGNPVVHEFAAGPFIVNLTVDDDAGAHADATVNVTVAAPPVVTVVVLPTSDGTLGFTYSASVVGAAGPFSFHWQFGDGHDGIGQNVTHTYAQPGSYDVALHVTDRATGAVFEQEALANATTHPPSSTGAVAPLLPIVAGAAGVAGAGAAALVFLRARRRAP